MPAFAHAIELGVTTLETDLALTRDDALVLSHDPCLNPDITRDASGGWLTATGPPIRALALAELMQFDVGRLRPDTAYAKRFPRQRPVDRARIPTLSELFATTAQSHPRLRYNIEIKTFPLSPGLTAKPEHFARCVVKAIRIACLQSRVTVQSFDWRALLAMRDLAPEIATSGLTIERTAPGDGGNVTDAAGNLSSWLVDPLRSSFAGSVPGLVAAAGCRIWSPFHGDLDAGRVAEANALGLTVLPWTVNETAEMQRLIAIGVDGLITDDPDVARAVIEAAGLAIA